MATKAEKQLMQNAFIQSLAGLCLAVELAEMDIDDDRKKRKNKVIKLKSKAIVDAFEDFIDPVVVGRKTSRWEALEEKELTNEDAKALLIDLSFSNPFAPYQLEYKEKDLLSAATKVGQHLGLSSYEIEGIWTTRKEALDSHSEISWGKIIMFAVGGGVVLAAGGWMAAPFLGAYLGGGAGLAGAAAMAHGLALLGGGSLALGGMGMAGGMWLVTGVGAAAGIALGGGGVMLIQIGSGAAKVELVKLQISFKEITISGQVDRAKAQQAILKLEEERQELERKLVEEKELNDKNSGRIKEIEAILETMGKSINWMRKVA